jgi:hypothetical protein
MDIRHAGRWLDIAGLAVAFQPQSLRVTGMFSHSTFILQTWSQLGRGGTRGHAVQEWGPSTGVDPSPSVGLVPTVLGQ